ncbi:MAG TPA: hypothetical protein VNK91_01155 [Burkholderiaceae bacterium]|nr:hypothetical protein [Burkholderiaceae bacterium]
MKLRTSLAAIVAAAPLAAHAYDINTIGALTQREFLLLSEDMAAALSFKPIIPAEASGITGFDIGAGITGTTLKNAVLLSKASGGESVPKTLPIVTVRAHKGLPFNIDVGVSYSTVPDADIKLVGGELRYAILPGSTLLPAVAIRASGSQLSGIDQWKMKTYGADVSVSKGFAIFTPYAGVGQVWAVSTPNVAGLQEEKFNKTKAFVGVNVNVGINFAFEYDNTGGINSYSAKVGFRW